VSAAATEAMDDTLTAAAGSDEKLQAAAKQIRENNKRMHALLTVDDALKVRQAAEGSMQPWSVRAASKAAGMVGGGGLAGAMYSAQADPENLVRNIAIGAAGGAAARSLPAVARAFERGRTTRAIEAMQNPTAATNAAKTAERVSRPMVSALARIVMGRKDGTDTAKDEATARENGATDQDIAMAIRNGERRKRRGD
jgi:hypothetical protein